MLAKLDARNRAVEIQCMQEPTHRTLMSRGMGAKLNLIYSRNVEVTFLSAEIGPARVRPASSVIAFQYDRTHFCSAAYDQKTTFGT